MSLVQYDSRFDRKVDDGAAALLKDAGIGPDREDFRCQHERACQQARLVLLTAMAIDAEAADGRRSA